MVTRVKCSGAKVLVLAARFVAVFAERDNMVIRVKHNRANGLLPSKAFRLARSKNFGSRICRIQRNQEEGKGWEGCLLLRILALPHSD